MRLTILPWLFLTELRRSITATTTGLSQATEEEGAVIREVEEEGLEYLNRNAHWNTL